MDLNKYLNKNKTTKEYELDGFTYTANLSGETKLKFMEMYAKSEKENKSEFELMKDMLFVVFDDQTNEILDKLTLEGINVLVSDIIAELSPAQENNNSTKK